LPDPGRVIGVRDVIFPNDRKDMALTRNEAGIIDSRVRARGEFSRLGWETIRQRSRFRFFMTEKTPIDSLISSLRTPVRIYR